MFDAGSIEAKLTVDTSPGDRSLDAFETRVKAFESEKHSIKLTADLDTSSLSRARQQFAQLDQQVSKDAMSRLRSSPQGSVLGALNALFSPHQVTGAPSPQQAAQQGLLGKIVQAPGTGNAGPAAGQNVVQAVTGSGGGQSNANQDITTTDRVNTVGLPQSGGTISTQDRVNVTGLPTSGGTIVTEDKVKADLDTTDVKAKAAQAGKDAADAADDALTKEAKSKGSGWFSGFLGGITAMIGKAAGGGGGNGKSGGGDSSGSALDSGLIGGIGPGIAGVSTQAAAITAAVGTALAALPALAGVAGTGLGVALIGGAVAGVIATSPKLKASFASLGQQAETVFTDAAKPLVPAISAVLNQVPALLKSLEPQLAGIFKVVAPQIQGVFAGLTTIIEGLVGVMRAAAPAFGPFIEALEKLAGNVFPGIETVVRATVPVISQFGAILGQLGSSLGGLFSSAAPAIKASMTVLGDLLSVVGGLLPVLTQLGGIFATALAPVFTQFGAVVKSLEPVLILVGQVAASLAKAVVGDLVSAFGAVATAVKAATPGLTALATGLGNVFTVMENAGVFAVLGDALERLAAPLGTLVGTLAAGLVPILTQVVTFVGQLSTVIVAQLTSAIVQLLPSVTQLATVALAALGEVLPVILPLLVQVAGVLTGALAATITGIATALTAVISAIPPAVLGTVAVGIAAVAGGMKLWAAGMAAVEASGLATVVTGMVGSLKDFAAATEGATLAEKGLLASEIAVDAISPMGWAVIAVAAIGGLVYGLSQLNDGIGGTVSALAKQDGAVGYNISGYQKLAAQTKALGDQQTKAADSIGASAAKNAGQVKQVLGAAGAAYDAYSSQFTAVAVNMQTRLTALSGTFGVSKTTIEQWAAAAGITPKAFASAGESAGQLTTQIVAFIDKNAQAVTATSSLGTNVAIFGNDVFSTTTQLDAFNQIFNTLVGNLLTKQQAVTQGQQSFDNLKQSIAGSGAASTQSQQSFQAYIGQIQSSLDSLQKGGASVSTLNSYLQTQIDHLTSLHNLSPGEQQDLANLKTLQDTLANSTNGLNAAQQTLIGQFVNGLIPSLQQIGADTPGVNTDISNLANSIIQTGNSSASTKADRDQLIADLKQAGATSQQAATFVDGLQGKIDALKGKVVNVGVTASASGTITVGTQGLSTNLVDQILLRGMATGGRVGGTGNSDSVLAMLTPGEVVVPKAMVAGGAVDHLKGMLPGFASGGLVSLVPDTSAATGAAGARILSAESTAVVQALANAIAAQQAAAAKAAAAAFTASGGASGGIIQAMFATMAAAKGWTGAELTALLEVEAREAGFSITATNPTSGAYGLAQFINGPSEYAQYGGNSTTASGQITGMLNYIQQRYGDPIAAENHEIAYGWYDRGGPLKPGYTLAYNGTGRSEQVVSGKSMDDLASRLDQLHADMREMVTATRQVPAGVGQHVGGAINGASAAASFRNRYPR